MILAPTNRRIIRPGEKPSFEHTQRYGLIRGHWANINRVGCWLFNEGSGRQIIDLSGDRTGSFGGTPVWRVGKSRSAIDFEASDAADFIDLGPTSILTPYGPWSIVVGFNVENIDAGGKDLFAQYQAGAGAADDGRLLFRVNTANLSLFLGDDSAHGYGTETLNYAVVANRPYQGIVTRNGGEYRLYCDGIQRDDLSEGTGRAIQQEGNLLGAHSDTSANPYNEGLTDWMDGLIEYVGIYNRTLTVGEAAQLSWDPFLGIERRAAPVYFFVPGEIKEITGIIAAQTVVSGTIDVSRKIAGVTTAQTAVTGSIDVTRKLTGTIGGQSVVSGSIKVLRKLVSTIGIQSSISGILSGEWLLNGTIACVSSITGNLIVPAGGFSNYAENNLLDHLTGKTFYSKPTVYLGFCTASPGEEATGADCSEVSNTNGYARVATTGADWNSASGGSIDNANKITSPCASGSWGEVTHYALFDSPTYGQGNVLVYDEVDASRVIEEDDMLEFAAGELSLTLD